jgi:hypothetical protein
LSLSERDLSIPSVIINYIIREAKHCVV